MILKFIRICRDPQILPLVLVCNCTAAFIPHLGWNFRNFAVWNDFQEFRAQRVECGWQLHTTGYRGTMGQGWAAFVQVGSQHYLPVPIIFSKKK